MTYPFNKYHESNEKKIYTWLGHLVKSLKYANPIKVQVRVSMREWICEEFDSNTMILHNESFEKV